jgi:pimeloyl-ACP methyl ester carboxylesterase
MPDTLAGLYDLSDAGHWVHHDPLDRFLEVVTRFLASG